MAYVGNTPFGPSCPSPTRVFAQVNTGFRSVRRSVGLAHDPTSQETPASPGMSLAGARLLARWVCHERWSLGSVGGSRGWRCCAVDEGWPFGVALRGEASNRLM